MVLGGLLFMSLSKKQIVGSIVVSLAFAVGLPASIILTQELQRNRQSEVLESIIPTELSQIDFQKAKGGSTIVVPETVIKSEPGWKKPSEKSVENKEEVKWICKSPRQLEQGPIGMTVKECSWQ